MSTRVHITFFNIQECGLYKRNQEEVFLGGVRDVFSNLQNWIQGSNLGQTSTYSDNSRLKTCYCLDVSALNDDYLVSLWNEVESTKNGVASINKNEAIGADYDVSLTKIPRNGIPGFPSYFWIMPKEGIYATVVPDNRRLAGNSEFRLYLKEFIRSFSRFCEYEWDEESDEHLVKGYRKPGEADLLRLYPRFSSVAIKRPSQTEVLRNKCNEIKKIIRKSRIKIKADEPNAFSRFLAAITFGLHRTSVDAGDYKIRTEIDVTPTEEDLEEIIENEADELGEISGDLEDDRWSDVGFVIGSKIVWLKNRIAAGSYILYGLRNREYIPTEELLSSLNSIKSTIISEQLG